MGLLEAIAIPLGSKILPALIKGDLQGVSSQVLDAFFGLILDDLDSQHETLNRIERKLDQVLDQDYARDFETARVAISDAFRASSPEEYSICLSEAWTRLRSAAAGTQDPLRKADAHYLAAITALLRSRPADALERSRQGYNLCVNVAIEHWFMFQYCGGDGLRNKAYRAQYRSPRLQAAELSVFACSRADELSMLLAHLGRGGAPGGVRPFARKSVGGRQFATEPQEPAVANADPNRW